MYHREHGARTLRELARSDLAITGGLTRVMSRLKAIYRSWAIPCAVEQVCSPRYRAEWLAKISEAGVRRQAERYYQQFDSLVVLRLGMTGTASGGPETPEHEVAAADSHYRPDPGRAVGCAMVAPTAALQG